MRPGIELEEHGCGLGHQRPAVRNSRMPSLGSLIVAIVSGLLGMAYFIYGKRDQNLAFLFAGIGLCVVPYFVGGVWLELLVSAALAAAPFVLR